MIISILSLFITPYSFAEGELNIKAKSAILMDYNTRKVIYEQNAHERVAPASITKIMTLLLAMEALESGKISLMMRLELVPMLQEWVAVSFG